MTAPDWTDTGIEDVKRLTLQQERRLMNMVEVMREHPFVLEQIIAIKNACSRGDYMEAQNLWLDFSEEEQNALFVAPGYGGIFKTHERNAVKYGREQP